MHKGKTLLAHIDSEERKRIESERKFKMPNYRTGDVLDITLYNSLSEGKFHTQRGLIIGKSMPNNLRHSMTFHAVGDEMNYSFKVKVHSPLLANVEVYKYGSNQNRKKLWHVPALELSASKVTEPIIKGKNYKKRVDIGKPTNSDRVVKELTGLEKPAKGKTRKGSFKLDQAENY
jgi:ribosomal protein L19